MNRRQFIQMLGMMPLFMVLRGEPVESFSALLLKVLDDVAGGKKPDGLDRENLRLALDNVDHVSTVTGGWIDNDGKVKPEAVNFPVVPLFSKVLEADASEVVINIPPVSIYRNLILLGQGQTTDITLNSIRMQLNGDTGNNYDYQLLNADNVTVTAQQNLGGDFLFLGTWGTSNAASRPGGFVVNIPNFASNVWKKTYESFNYVAESNTLQFVGGVWHNTAKIEKIRIYHASVNLAAGSLISLLATP